MTVALGASSRKISSRFASSSVLKLVIPVAFPPGRLRLATRPSLTGSPPPVKTIGMVAVVALARHGRNAAAACGNHGHMTANQIGSQGRKLVVPIHRPPEFDRHVSSLDVADFAQALAERGYAVCVDAGCSAVEESDRRHRRLLRAGGERHHRRCATQKSDELATSHHGEFSTRPVGEYAVCSDWKLAY